MGPKEPLFLYMFDRGDTGEFCIDEPQRVSSMQLKSWLDDFEQAANTLTYVIYAACESGSFTDHFSNTGRVIATSCRDGEYCVSTSMVREGFSQPFWTEIRSGIQWDDLSIVPATLLRTGYSQAKDRFWTMMKMALATLTHYLAVEMAPLQIA